MNPQAADGSGRATAQKHPRAGGWASVGSRMSISGRPDGGRPDDHQWASAPQNALIAALTPRPPGGSADEPSAGGWMSIGGWASRSAELMWTHVELMWTHAGLMCSSCGIMLVSCGAHVNSCGAHGARVGRAGGASMGIGRRTVSMGLRGLAREPDEHQRSPINISGGH